MKLSYSRRYRRNSSRSRENKMFNKDNRHEHAFFAAPSKESFFKPNAAIQRKCTHCEAEDKQVSRMNDGEEEEKKVHKMEDKKEEDKSIHKMEDNKEEKEIHKMDEKKEEKEVHKMDEKEDKKIAKKSNQAEGPAPRASAYIHSLDGKGNALPDHAKQFFGQRMGYDFSSVKIHTGTDAEQSAKDLNAKAYAVDHNIVFNKGQYKPGTIEGDKLLAHELAHIVQNKKAEQVNRKEQLPEKEEPLIVNGTSSNNKNKKAFGQCQGVSVQGQTDFKTLPSSFRTQVSSRTATPCEECAPKKCVTVSGTIISTFNSRIKVTLPPVPSGLSRCETKAVGQFINTTLRSHEQEHVTAFRTYNGTVKTPFTYTGCPGGLKDYVKSIHDGIDSQRSADAIAASDALDPFVRPIPCECE